MSRTSAVSLVLRPLLHCRPPPGSKGRGVAADPSRLSGWVWLQALRVGVWLDLRAIVGLLLELLGAQGLVGGSVGV